jgi:hypothetical protein
MWFVAFETGTFGNTIFSDVITQAICAQLVLLDHLPPFIHGHFSELDTLERTV